jgi:hypothetical protein
MTVFAGDVKASEERRQRRIKEGQYVIGTDADGDFVVLRRGSFADVRELMLRLVAKLDEVLGK